MKRVAAWYEYQNVKGEPRIRKRRWDPKAFDMQSWTVCGDGTGRWLRGIRDNRIGFAEGALYRLPEVVAALRVDATVWWTEGEKDADTLCKLSLTATSTWQGAGRLNHDQAAWFGRYRSRSEVLIVVDQDLPGAWFGWERYRVLTDEVGVDPRRIHVLAPRWGWGKDVSDWLEKGRRPNELRTVDLGRLREAAERYGADRASRYTHPQVSEAGRASGSANEREPRSSTNRGSLPAGGNHASLHALRA